MVKAWCVWCETGSGKPSTSGYFWMHMDCAQQMMNYKQDIKSIKEMLEGTHARNRFEVEKNQNKIEVIYDFIKEMEEHEARWLGTMKIFRNFTGGYSKQSKREIQHEQTN